MVDVWGSLPTWQWVLLGIGLYWLAVVWLREADLLPDYVGNQGPVLTLHTRRFRDFVDRVAAPARAWRAWGNAGIGVALVVMVGTFVFLAIAAYSQLRQPAEPSAINEPQNILVIPGVNEFLPLSVAPEIVFGLVVGLVVHEGGHAILCRVGDIEIESMGLALLAVLPIGAFVEPDEDSRRAADRGDQTRMFAAGVMNNFAITILAFALLFGPVAGAIAVAPGAAVGGVYPGSAAADAGIEAGDRIVAVAGREVQNNSDLGRELEAVEDRQIRVRVDDGSGVRNVTLERSLLVVGATAEGPFAPVATGDRIVAVNGTSVGTEAALARVLQDREVATVETADGTTATAPAGAAVDVTADGPAASAGVPTGPAIVTAVGDDRVHSGEALATALSDTEPGQTVRVVLYVNGSRQVHEVTLGENPQSGQGFLGVQITQGVSGLIVSDVGIQLYPADLFLGLAGGDLTGPFWVDVRNALFLPFTSLLGGSYNFAGFTGDVANFYSVPGLPPALVGLVFGLANGLFWTGWVNLNLGLFNCVPAFPLDGGHILRTSTESIIARLPIDDRRRATTLVTTSVGLTMLASLVLMVFGPQLLR